ncbi:MAG: hypothetical protein IKY75_03160 [Bacteroidaceae bacterium]|nr:hypothetical protein [Bacteroidaceae bacterium]
MKRFLSLFILLLGVVFALDAQSLSNYRLEFDKRDMGSGALKVTCEFTIDFAGEDSLVLDFGGNFEELAVEELMITPADVRYTFDPIAKHITFYRAQADTLRVEMGYIYMNFTSVFMYNNKGAEVWECISTDSGEYYYPMRRGMLYSGEVLFHVPDALQVVTQGSLIATEWLRINQCVPLNFVFLDCARYEMNTMPGSYKCDVYQLKGQQAEADRYAELCRLAVLAIEWFEAKYGDAYIDPVYGTHDYPAFVFHNGNASFNRYNMGFISASQEKFATAPDIYPLMHEIGHRWMGEYTMFIESGSRGYAFVVETLNEFMTLQCIREVVGIEAYEELIADYRMRWDKIRGTEQDVHPIEVTENNNIPVTYRKGVVMLDSIAREVGYDAVIATIVEFYQAYKGKPNLRYEDFEQLCKFSL